MATSAFKSTTERASIGGSTPHRSLRRSRSLSRFSRPIAPEPEAEMDYIKNVPRGKFVNTTRGSTAPFPEISLDDLALEFFSSSSKNESDGAAVEREGRSASRRGEIGRWASDTASSRRRGRSVSRGRGEAVSSGSAASGGPKNAVSSDASSRRRRSISVARSRGDAAPATDKDAVAADAGTRRRRSLSVARTSGNAVPSGGKDAVAADAGTRRRSLSVARYQISDSESDIDRSQNSSNRATMIAPTGGNAHLPLASKATASSYRRLGRSRSQIDLSLIHDGYSSQSSALTDDESKDTHFGKNGFEKIIRAVHAQKKAMGRNQTALANDCSLSENSKTLQDPFRIREKYAQKLEQLEKRKKNLLTEMLLEEQCGREVSAETYEELPNSRASAVTEKPPQTRKRSSDRSRMSERLIEDAERYFEDFISNIEDTDLSSFDGERSDESSTLGGMVKGRDFTIGEAETCRTPAGSASRPAEMDGVILPWLKWETSHDGSPCGKTILQTPTTPQALHRNSEKDSSQLNDASSYSMSSHGSWSPGLFHSSPMDKREEVCPTKTGVSKFDMDEYLNLHNNEEILFEMYRERNRIGLGGLLLCIGALH
ncbi:uncharacterized protein LOC130987793 isoform X2 [Salvia miltiorrhiza]|uniref:uncharacterized protein LOC130987793 isoform X2 n=1 Tax=Salvia miltiorrhiza TaxID=226208 RepID=UPI0025AB69C8|nr:uncharacterized protein LOC130987793 isoform X2 [Salvia miltiorrhiza]